MGKTILIVEDEFLVALNLSRTLNVLGYKTVGIAPDAETALRLANEKPDIALVDVNLRDGETGPAIGRMLAQKYGAAVLFVTANPASLGNGIDGTIGCVSKPLDETQVETVLGYLADYEADNNVTPPPSLRIFKLEKNAVSDKTQLH